ncbi:MAG: thioredoxin domain-containing protein [Desulfobacteraceae bacterium]|nr:thioredoxin domain-containing protein [Desulfobacteraceae bacterium]
MELAITGTSEQNRLINEKSPYLIQHADNPVDWYPWGDEAFKKAEDENKPILVSIGYSTCHWCHVMADESFSDPAIADIMNQDFVNIKIDREERPDLDQIYISSVSAMRGSAGWPLNVFLTPDAKPFFGGTYFPAKKRFGMPSWKEVLTAVAREWKSDKDRKKLLDSAEGITDALKQYLNGGLLHKGSTIPDKKAVRDTAKSFYESHDSVYGGFSSAPKFPMPVVLDFLLFYHCLAQTEDRQADEKVEALDIAVHTMRKMARGGIFDHVGGGFHRYSTDEYWHVPHFEKMLYDNSQLITVYLKAYEITGYDEFAATARQSLEYVFRNMTHPLGGFYSAQDADSPEFDLAAGKDNKSGNGRKAEGAYYAWRKTEIDSVLDKHSAAVVSYHYDIRSQGNAQNDAFGEFTGKNILRETGSIKETAQHFGLSRQEVRTTLESAGQKLLEARSMRPAPQTDDKIITEWNSLMISALAQAGRVLGDERYRIAAKKAVDFINASLFSGKGELYRRWRGGECGIAGLASDYAFFVQALLDMYEAFEDREYMENAVELGDRMLDRFYDSENGGFFITAPDHDPRLIFRAKDFMDGVLPAAGSVAAMNCIRLFRLTQEKRFLEAARRTFIAAEERINRQPQSAPLLIAALGSYYNDHK